MGQQQETEKQRLCRSPYPQPKTTHTNSGPSRISRPLDLLLALAGPFLPKEKAYAKGHPYWVNYEGMRNLLAAVKAAGVPKVIRVSGLSGEFQVENKGGTVPCAWSLDRLIDFLTVLPFLFGHATVGYSAFNPVTILLNLVVSFAVRWQVRRRHKLQPSH